MAIHDQNYVRYEGNIDSKLVWWTIATTTFASYLKFLRTKLTLIFLWLAPLIMGFLVFAEYGVRNAMGGMTGQAPTAPSGEYISFYIQVVTFSLAVLFMAAGSGVISDDLRHKTFQLYFSKPLSKLDYILGKFLGLFLLGSLVSIVPALAIGVLRIALYGQSEFAKDVALKVIIGIAIITFINMMISAILLGLSSLTSRTGYVVLSWVGVLVVPLILNGIVAIATSGADHAGLWSLTGNVKIVSDWLLTDDAILEGILILSPFVLLALTIAGIGTLFWRVSKLEGVA